MAESLEQVKEYIKKIILSLRMCGFSQVDADSLQKINELIKNLPSAESIDGYDKSQIKELEKYVGDIDKIVEIYSRRDMESKTRHIDKTGLPPRYRVLNWRTEMNSKANAVQNIIKLSSVADDKGCSELSSRLIRCAKNILEDKIDQKEIEAIRVAIVKNNLEKEAGFWSGVKGLGQGVKGFAKGVGQAGREMFQVGNYQGALDEIRKKISAILPDISKAAEVAQNPERKKVLGDISVMLSNMYEVSQKVYKLVHEETTKETQETQKAAAPASAAPAPTAATGGDVDLSKLSPEQKQQVNDFIKGLAPSEIEPVAPTTV